MVDSARRAIESLYEGVCTIYVNEPKRVNGVTKSVVVECCTDQPCRVSYKNSVPVSASETKSTAYQEIKLFIAPEVEIKEGAKIVVTQYGKTSSYRRSGKPLVYKNHQEILLESLETS